MGSICQITRTPTCCSTGDKKVDRAYHGLNVGELYESRRRPARVSQPLVRKFGKGREGSPRRPALWRSQNGGKSGQPRTGSAQSMHSPAILVGLALLSANIYGGEKTLTLSWRDLPELPQAVGGQFVGVVDDYLVVAGGSYFNTPPWSGGKKIWVDTVYTLGRGDKQWRLAGHLPTPLGYGIAAISTADGMLCIGGQTPAVGLRQSLPPSASRRPA